LLNKTPRVVIYTALFGPSDGLIEPPVEIENCDFVCYTDNKKITSSIYKVIYCEPLNDSIRAAKIYKILPHKFLPEYKYSLWIDGNVQLKPQDIYHFVIDNLKAEPIAFLKNPERDCIYDEMGACIKQKKDDPRIMEKQIDYYRKQNYPEHNGLISGGVILRKHMDPRGTKHDEDWCDQVQKFSRRDQLSFNYVAWKNNMRYKEIDLFLWDNTYFKIIPHKKDIYAK